MAAASKFLKISAFASHKSKKREDHMNDWLMMLYLGADEDLLPFGKELLDEVGRVGSTERVSIMAELNRTPADAKTLRGLIRPGQTHEELPSIGIANGDIESIID